jgi:hypothetical protein
MTLRVARKVFDGCLWRAYMGIETRKASTVTKATEVWLRALRRGLR